MDTITLQGKTALVTGASRGIGRAAAVALAKIGAAVAVNYRTRSQEAEAVSREIEDMGGRAVALQADVSSTAEVSGWSSSSLGRWPCCRPSVIRPRPYWKTGFRAFTVVLDLSPGSGRRRRHSQ